MPGVTILDRSPDGRTLGFDLIDILLVLGDDARRSVWTVHGIEALGRRADELHDKVLGEQLVELARGVDQVIDGTLAGRLPGADAPWIVIRAVDSSAFDVETTREDVIDALRARFSRVADLPD